jgi:hypothetical protein
MTALQEYQYLWDGSSPDWCLLEAKSFVKDYRKFIIFNPKKPEKSPLINHFYQAQVKDKMLQAGARVIPLNEDLGDPIRDYLRREGFLDWVVYRTFDYLIDKWEFFVNKVVSGKYRGRNDYLHDLGTRENLEELIDFADTTVPFGIQEHMYKLDFKLKTILQPSSIGSIWMAEFTNDKYSSEKHWYYFMLPVYMAEEWENEVVRVREIMK